jgi:hypothetical protein
MKVAIVGSRTFNNYELMIDTLDNIRKSMNIEEIISGGADGADKLAERYAAEYEIPLKVYKPDWSLGKHAGLLRNTIIVDSCDIVIAFWDGKSTGTRDSIVKAKKMGKSLLTVAF